MEHAQPIDGTQDKSEPRVRWAVGSVLDCISTDGDECVRSGEGATGESCRKVVDTVGGQICAQLAAAVGKDERGRLQGGKER